jgi:hypothetical protein
MQRIGPFVEAGRTARKDRQDMQRIGLLIRSAAATSIGCHGDF